MSTPLYIVLLSGQRCEVWADDAGYHVYRPDGVLLTCQHCEGEWLSDASNRLERGEAVTVHGRYPFGVESITCDLCGQQVHGEVL